MWIYYQNLAQKFISFDATALFTNIPLDITFDFLRRKLPTLNHEFPIPVDLLIDFFDIAVNDMYFEYDGNFYQQVFGFAMGNPLSPILANLFLEHLESEILPLYTGYQPIFWLRYVDDVLCLVSENFNLTICL